MIKELLSYLTDSIDYIGVIIITVGVCQAFYTLLVGTIGKSNLISLNMIRLELGRSIVLAVEFLLAADIIRTMITPDYYSIGMLGSLVVIRTVLIYFLDLELRTIGTTTNN